MRKKKSVSRNCDNCYCDRSLDGKLWFVSCKTMVSLFQNYELGLLTGSGIWSC